MNDSISWEKFENIMTGILGNIDIENEVEYFSIIDDAGDVKFWAGNRPLSAQIKDFARLMALHNVERMLLSSGGLRVLLFWLGGYIVSIASREESNVVFLMTLIENKYREEMERLEDISRIIGGEKTGEENHTMPKESRAPDPVSPPRLSVRSLD